MQICVFLLKHFLFFIKYFKHNLTIIKEYLLSNPRSLNLLIFHFIVMRLYHLINSCLKKLFSFFNSLHFFSCNLLETIYEIIFGNFKIWSFISQLINVFEYFLNRHSFIGLHNLCHLRMLWFDFFSTHLFIKKLFPYF